LISASAVFWPHRTATEIAMQRSPSEAIARPIQGVDRPVHVGVRITIMWFLAPPESTATRFRARRAGRIECIRQFDDERPKRSGLDRAVGEQRVDRLLVAVDDV